MKQKLLAICIIFLTVFLVSTSFAESKDTPQQVNVLKAQAKKNNISAIHKLVDYYYNQNSYYQAYKYIQQGAKLRDKVSEVNDALYMLHGWGGAEKNYKKAQKILHFYANQNYAPACNVLGVMYDTGLGVKKDEKKAIKYYKKAALLGSKGAKFNLAMLVQTRNPKLSFKIFLELAHQKDLMAMLAVGFLYQDGYGVSKSLPQAYKWFVVLKNLDYKPSQIALINLIKEMTPEQIAQGKKLVIEYNRQHIKR